LLQAVPGGRPCWSAILLPVVGDVVRAAVLTGEAPIFAASRWRRAEFPRQQRSFIIGGGGRSLTELPPASGRYARKRCCREGRKEGKACVDGIVGSTHMGRIKTRPRTQIQQITRSCTRSNGRTRLVVYDRVAADPGDLGFDPPGDAQHCP
jgi:hypothetical protein